MIVAHSKVRLIGKAMLLDPRSEPILRGMVAVATPFSGSKFWKRVQSNRWIRRSPLDLFHPENVLLVELSAADRVNAKIVSLAPEFDQMIPQGSELVGATNRTIPIEGHFRVASDPRVWPLVHHWVDRFWNQERAG